MCLDPDEARASTFSAATPLQAVAQLPAPVPVLGPTLEPARPRGFLLRDVPGLEALFRRSGRIPVLRANRPLELPGLEVPPGVHLLCRLNGQMLRLLRPGRNALDPALLLLPGDRLGLERYPGDQRHAHTAVGPRAPSSTYTSRHFPDFPTESDILAAAFGEEVSAPQPPAAVPTPLPFAGLTAFQRGQRGLLSRLLSWT